FGDYPQLGMDGNGVYITTNEFDNLGNGEFHGAQLYALSKADLESGDHTPSSQYFQNVPNATLGDVSYTLEPANGLPQDWDTRERPCLSTEVRASSWERGSTTERSP